MADARTQTAEQMLDRVNYELRNSHQKQFSSAEMLSYVNKWCEFIYMLLCEDGSDLVRTGTGTITTASGTQTYDLSSNSMGDLWFPYKVWISGYEPMEMCSEDDRYEYVMAVDNGDTNYSIPDRFYIESDTIGLLPFPDDEYTLNIKYYPNFVPLSASSENIPFKNLFNLVLEEGAVITAKNRESYGSSVDAALMEIFKDRALFVTKMRQKQTVAMSLSDEWV